MQDHPDILEYKDEGEIRPPFRFLDDIIVQEGEFINGEFEQVDVEKEVFVVPVVDVVVVDAHGDLENKLPDDLRTLTVYPEPMMTHEQVKHGGFILYVFGKCHTLKYSN